MTLAGDIELGSAMAKTYGLEENYAVMAAHFDISVEDAMRADFHNAYYFWLHWGQYSSTNDKGDLEELVHVLRSYSTASLNYSWNHSLFAKPSLDPKYVSFVDDVLANYDGDFMQRG